MSRRDLPRSRGAGCGRVAVAASLAATVLPSLALAESADAAARAEALLNEGRTLRDHGRVADACSRFAQSKALAPGVGASLELADCFERLGKTTSAWYEFTSAEKLARERHDRRAEDAHAHVETLQARLSRVTIAVSAETAADVSEIRLDRQPVPPQAYNTALAVDPGDHVMSVVPRSGPLRTLDVHVVPDAPVLTVRAEDARSKLDAKAEAPARTPQTPADALFEEGKRLREAGQTEEACAKFAQSQALEPGVGITLHLGDCYERIGRTAGAWAEFSRAEKAAHEQGDKREAVAHARALALDPKLHPVAAGMPGAAPQVDASFAELGASAAPASPAPAGADDRAASTRRWVEIGLLGGAVVAAGVGAGLLVVKNDSMSNGAAGGNPYVDPVAAAASKVAFIVAGAAAASAVVLYLVAPKKKDAALYVSPTTMAAGAGASLGGKF